MHLQESQKIKISRFLEPIAEKYTELSPQYSQLTPKPLVQSKILNDIMGDLIPFANQAAEGFATLDKTIAYIDIPEQFVDHINKIVEVQTQMNSLSIPEVTKIIEDKTVGEIYGLTEEDLQTIYNAAEYQMNHEHFEEASQILFLLTFLEPANSFFWLALGVSKYNQKRYEECLKPLQMAFVFNEDDCTSLIYAAYASEAMGDYNQALNLVNYVLEIYEGKETSNEVNHLKEFKTMLESKRG